MKKLLLLGQLLYNMGARYSLFRALYEAKRRFLPFKLYAPTYAILSKKQTYLEWLKQRTAKVFVPRGTCFTSLFNDDNLRTHFENIKNGQVYFFRNEWKQIDLKNPWHKNLDSGFEYDKNLHWSKIPDYSKTQGDIKYVWERARFTHLLDIIRYDQHFEQDNAKLVLNEIENWIDNNPSEKGPHYRCSQEVSLRLLNWFMALDFYEGSEHITEAFWNKYQQSVYEQWMHVYHNINFSRIAVRNNHAITETLLLYIGGSLFPHFPNASNIKNQGRKFLEEEIAYQIYPDGTYLQYSNNYHRVVIQLLTIAISFAERINEKWSDTFYQRAEASLQFLLSQCDETSGELPNYGSNDGALFFPLSNARFRDYRPALNALHVALYKQHIFAGEAQEEALYLCNLNKRAILQEKVLTQKGLCIFNNSQGTYAIIKTDETLSFLKCCAYKDRPAQADNLHLDIWYKGKNMLRDNGSYKYNASDSDIRYFMGTASHNTVQLGEHDQMLKGGRFIWYYWNKQASSNSQETRDAYTIEATVNVYAHLKKGIRHTRKLQQSKDKVEWLIEDSFNEIAGEVMKQLWHIAPEFLDHFEITAEDENGSTVDYKIIDAYYSSHYGRKEPSKCIIFTSDTKKIRTRIALKT